MNKLPMGTIAEIGPGFFPKVIAGFLLLIGLMIMFGKTDD